MCTMQKMMSMSFKMFGMKPTWIPTTKMMIGQYYECDEEWDETYFGSQVDWSPTASEWNPSEAAVEDESLFDVAEFDSVYSAYADAKSRFAQLRQSRGFYPVVALVDGKGSSMSQGGGSSKSKGQSKKGSKQSPYPPKGTIGKGYQS